MKICLEDPKIQGGGGEHLAQADRPTRLALVIFGMLFITSAIIYCTYLVFAYFTAQTRLTGTKEFATLNLDIQNSNSTSIVSNSYSWSNSKLTPGDTITLENIKVANTGDTACYALLNFQVVITPVSNLTPTITYSTWYNLSGDLVHTSDLTANVTPSSSISANSSTNLTLSYILSGEDITNAYKGANAHMSLNACAIQSSYLAGVSTNLDAVSYIISNSGIVASPTTYTLTMNLGETTESYTLIGGSTIQNSMKACGLDVTYSNTETIGLFTDSALMHTLTARDCLWGNKTLYTRIATQEYITTGTPSNGTVTITGSGSLSSESTAQDVVIPASVVVNGTTYPVTSISANAFKNNTNVTSVTIPSGVTTIGSNAFSGCSNLTTVNIPNTVTSIGGCAFMDSGLENIDLNDAEALANFDISSLRNTKITEITVPASVATIGPFAFGWCTELTTFEFEEGSQLQSAESAFYGCSKLTSVRFPAGTKISGPMFSDCSSLVECDVSQCDISTASSIVAMFRGCSKLTSLDISNWNTTNITDMSVLFSGCSSLTSLDLSGWDTSNVTTMSSIFHGCRSLTNINISNFDTSNVTDMSYMFRNCGDAVVIMWDLDLSNFNTSKVTSMGGMFYGCGAKSINLSSFDTSKVTNMASMFLGCTHLTGLDLSNFNTSDVTNMSHMFRGIYLTTLDLSNFDTAKVTNMSYMFYQSSALTSLDLSSFDTTALTNTSSMFYSCTKLQTITVDDGWSMTNVTESANMFYNCSKLVGGNGTTYNSSYVDATYARIDTAGTPGYFTAKS